MSRELPATGADRLGELLIAWQQELSERGRDVPAEELCRDSPELLPELSSRIQAMRRIEALRASSAAPPAANGEGSPSGISSPSLPPVYELLDRIGSGGMGVVYKARNVALNRVEAIKLTKAGEFAGPHDLARFRFEAEAAAGLEHPNIVTVYGVGDGRSGPYLTMRWVDGESLEKRRPGSQQAVAALVAKIARAVHYAHQHGILHRDLKPLNILVDESGEPHVTDFGIARRLGADPTLTQLGSPLGTPAYMSPEQARGEANLTVVSDVYSLGVVLFELLTGRLPFGGSVGDLLRKIQSDEAAPELRQINPAISPDLEAVCLKCLEKDCARRYQTAAELAEELDRYLRGEGVTARAPGLWDWLRQLSRTRPDPRSYQWPVLAWFGAIMLACHGAVFGLAVAEGRVVWVWVSLVLCATAASVVLWWYILRRFQHRPVTERHSTMIAAAHILGQTALLVLIPIDLNAPGREALQYYPPLLAISGMGLFVVGSTHWGRFVPIGTVVTALVPVATWWPLASPLLYGLVMAAVMWYWAYSLRVTFSEERERGVTSTRGP